MAGTNLSNGMSGNWDLVFPIRLRSWHVVCELAETQYPCVWSRRVPGSVGTGTQGQGVRTVHINRWWQGSKGEERKHGENGIHGRREEKN